MQSRFANGNTDPNEDINYYYTFSSGITLITSSSRNPSHKNTNIVIKDVVLYNNTGLMGNLYIEYNACTTQVYIEKLNSSNCDIGVYLRPRLWRSPRYCTVYTAQGEASILMSVLSNVSLYLSVPQGDSRSLDDIVDRPDPELIYLHSVLLHNITIIL